MVMLDLSEPLTPGALLQAGTVIIAAITFFIGIRSRLNNVEKSLDGAIIELHAMREPLEEIAKQAVRVDHLEKEVDRLRNGKP